MARGKRRSRDDLDELSRLLLDLRERADMTQPEAASGAGISQTMLSRAETGRKVPDTDTTRSLAQLYQATDAEQRRLTELVTLMEPARLDSRLVMQRGRNLHFQQRVGQIEKSCALIRAYQPGMVLGPLQTPAYARAVFTAPRSNRPASSASPASLAATRADRYRQLVEDPHRSWTLIQTEGALNWFVGTATDMAEQMDQLIAASRLPHVRLGIIPTRTPARVFAPHGYHLYDSRGVHIGTRTATALSTDQRDVEDYEGLFGELEKIAAFDEHARDVIARVGDEYRALK